MAVKSEIKALAKHLKDQGVTTADSGLHSKAKFAYQFGCAPLDIPYGLGIHSGKIYEIFGWESHGKSTLALEITKAFARFWDDQKETNYGILWVETESAFDLSRASYLGAPTDSFLWREAETIEEGEEIILATLEKATATGMRLLIVWDTIAAASTKNEKSSGPGTFTGGVGEKPRLIRSFLRKATSFLGKTDSTLVLVNQVITGPNSNPYQPESPGGGGIKFHCSVRTFVKKVGEIERILPNGTKDGSGGLESIIVELCHLKNKLILPKQRMQIVINTERGIDLLETLLKFTQDKKLTEIAGSWKRCTLPEKLWHPEDKGDVKMATMSWQNPAGFREILELKCPHMIEWLNYKVYEFYSQSSPLLKLRIINKVWEYEEKFFGKRLAVLTEEEERVAKESYSQINLDNPDEELQD